MLPSDEEERREYYRIEDRIALEISPLSTASAAQPEVLQDDSPLFTLLSEMHLSEFESQHLLRQLSDTDRTLAAYLRAQNKRVDLLGRIVAQTILDHIGTPQPVVLSEGGLEFRSTEAYPADCQLSLKMALMPQALGLLLRAKVIRCDRAEDGQYDIGTEFVELADAQRQLLARYVLQKQQLERRLAREQIEPPAA